MIKAFGQGRTIFSGLQIVLLALLLLPQLAWAQPEVTTATHAARTTTVSTLDTYDASDPGPVDTDFGPMGAALVRMVIALGAVCLLAYLVLGKALPKLMRVEPPTAPQRILRIVDRLALDQRRSVMVLKMGEQHFLVGATEHGIQLLSRLDADDVENALQQAALEGPAPLKRFSNLFLRSPNKES